MLLTGAFHDASEDVALVICVRLVIHSLQNLVPADFSHKVDSSSEAKVLWNDRWSVLEESREVV